MARPNVTKTESERKSAGERDADDLNHLNGMASLSVHSQSRPRVKSVSSKRDLGFSEFQTDPKEQVMSHEEYARRASVKKQFSRRLEPTEESDDDDEDEKESNGERVSG